MASTDRDKAAELAYAIIEEHSFSWAKSSGRRKVIAIAEKALREARNAGLEEAAKWFETTGHEQQMEWYTDEISQSLRTLREEPSDGRQTRNQRLPEAWRDRE